MAPRAFPQGVERLVRRATIVNSADDIRRVTTQCLADGTPCVLELGSNIVCSAGFTIPGGLKAFSIDGAQRYKLVVSESMPFLFYAKGAENNDGCPVEVGNVEILVKAGSTLTTAFVVEQASSIITLQKLSLSLNNVVVDGTSGTLTNVFSIGSTSIARVIADGLTMFGATNIFAGGSNLTAWTWSRLTDVIVTGAGASNATFGQGAASPAFIECVFMRIAGSVDIDVGDQSTNNFWAVVQGNGGVFRTNGAAGLRQTVLRVGNFGTRTLSVDDVDLDNISGGGGGGTTITAATITVPFGLQEQTVTVVDASCTAASKVIAGWGSTASTDENQPGACAVTFSAVPAAGSLDVTVSSDNADPVGGAYKILYTLG